MKGRERDLASNQFPECSPQNTQSFTGLGREEKRKGGDRRHLVEKKESPKEGRVVKPVISLSGKIGY